MEAAFNTLWLDVSMATDSIRWSRDGNAVSKAEERQRVAFREFEKVMKEHLAAEKTPTVNVPSDGIPTTLSRSVTGLGYEPIDSRVEKKGSVCPCRAAKGHVEGWCGVAGGGVPACDH